VLERRRLSPNAARDLSGLGVGAMLHDVGMTRLSPETLAMWNASHDERDPLWRAHVQRGFELLADQVEPAAAGVVLHHHQAVDGSGFPPRVELGGRSHPLAGSEIHVFARIAAAADLFDRLRNPAHAPGASDAAAPPLPVVRALSTLLRTPALRRRIDPIVLRALVNVTPPYAPGSIVTITGGRRAAVVDWSPADPCRPTVEIIGDLEAPPRRGDPVRERIDLRRAQDVCIIEAEGHDVRADNFSPSHPEEFDLVRLGREMTLGSQNAA
jgi:HD-GYP domain-containing protein (c-di-GMP phosphodiesterase class II)